MANSFRNYLVIALSVNLSRHSWSIELMSLHSLDPLNIDRMCQPC